MCPSSRWNFAIVPSSRCFFQLNEGEQLYASSWSGYSALIASANVRATSRSGFEVSIHSRSEYGAYASPRAMQGAIPFVTS
jgi:hypothetical protein